MKMLLADGWVHRDAQSEVIDPDDGSIVDTVPRASAADMEGAIADAVEGAEAARNMPVHARISVLDEAARTLENELEEFATVIAREGVKTIRESRKEVARAAVTLRLSAEEARRVQGQTIPFDQMPGSENRSGYYRLEPVGVVGAITPYNDPLNLVAHKVGPAIAAGNAIIVKPDSKTPLSALKLGRALHDAGLPDGILQVVTGEGREVGNVLVQDPRVRLISFTGGRETGEAIVRQAGLKKVAMELGSNAPVLVMDDADLDHAVESSVSGAFWAAGQNCLHVQRLLVHRAVYDEFKERFVAAAQQYRLGPKLDEDTDMGPLITEQHAHKVERMLQRAVQQGATVLTGGTRDGTRMAPTVVEGVPDEAELATDEVYGPVTLLRPVDSLEEGIQVANAVDFGLQAGIFTKDLDVAHTAIAELRYGGVMVNDSTDYRIDAMPFGGFKGSGLGREGVAFAVQEMTEPKVVCFVHR